jgi:hypothetical protein
MKKVIKLPVSEAWRDVTLGELHDYMASDAKASLEIYSYKAKSGITQAAVVHSKELHASGPSDEVLDRVRRTLIVPRHETKKDAA